VSGTVSTELHPVSGTVSTERLASRRAQTPTAVHTLNKVVNKVDEDATFLAHGSFL
jgi:hypothetical protein